MRRGSPSRRDVRPGYAGGCETAHFRESEPNSVSVDFAAQDPPALAARLDRVADARGFSGVVLVARGEQILYARTSGLADRAHDIPNRLDTRFAIASGTKALTALAVMSLVAEGTLALDANVQSVLAAASELVEREVTVRHLLAHTSGMGDYLD